MNGFPKQINSKQDIVNLAESHPLELAAWLTPIVAGVSVWHRGPEIATGTGVADTTHRVDSVTRRPLVADFDSGNGYSLSIDALARQRHTGLMMTVALALEAGTLATTDLVTIYDDTGAAHAETVADLKVILAAFGLYCQAADDLPDETVEFQAELIDNPNCKLYRLGLTVAEANILIGV